MKHLMRWIDWILIVVLVLYWLSGCQGGSFEKYLGHNVGDSVKKFQSGYSEGIK